ncbi:aldo/keto reductase [Amycolatopsis sp. NPDC005232]|uniref:aldo/keto reductase n=1 Tax=Amycolatopsis sp. NPDC005232 TaxID=3157027 RepID=UPI0033A09511
MSRIALGTMTFGGSGTMPWDLIGGLDLKAADELVGIALDQGVNLIDTADMYARGETEEILGKILKGRRRDVVLATKAYSRMGAGPNEVGLSRVHLRHAIEDSLRRLGTDHIDLYQIHAHDHLTPLDETLAALDDAVRQGKISYVGTSNTFAWQLAKALGVADLRGYPRFVSLQAYYSLVGRDLERELLPLVNEEKLGLLVYSPLAGGFLSGKFTRDSHDASGRRAQADNPPLDRERGYDIVDALRKIADRHDVGVARVALAWVLAQRGVTSVIVGAKRPDQLHENLAAVDLELTGQDLAELDAVSALRPEYPAWALDGAYPSRTP